ncbi:MAG: acyltransferase [Lachnospiraceae bacterium]|nr:acyltransferase [Lachnospiraceae bacterium]
MNDLRRPKRKRELYFDILWVIAILFLIFSFSDGVNAYIDLQMGTLPYYLSLFVALCVRFPLWLCLMISGAILLDMHEAIKTLWRRRILRVLIILIVFSFLYYLVDCKAGRDTFDLTRFIPDLYNRERITQFWYLYATLGFLVCLPFMRPMVKNMRDEDFIYLIMAVFVLSSIIPLFNQYVLMDRYTYNPSFKLEWITEVIFIYPVMGYFFHHRMSVDRCKRLALILVPLDILWLAYNTYILSNRGVSMGDYVMYPEYHSSVTMLHCVTLFVTAKALFRRREHRAWERVIGSLGGCSLGIYLLHGFFLDGRIEIIENVRLAVCGEPEGLGKIAAALLWSLIVYLVCYLPVWLLRRIPGLRDLTL